MVLIITLASAGGKVHPLSALDNSPELTVIFGGHFNGDEAENYEMLENPVS